MKSGIILRNPLEGTNQAQRMLVIGMMVFLVFMILMGIILRISDWRKKKKKQRDKN